MIITTYQDLKILDLLERDGIVYKDFSIPNNANRKPDTDKLYLEFFKLCEEKSGISFDKGAFWGIHTIECAMPLSGVKLVLDIPDDLVVLSNYYNWSDMIFFRTEEPDEETFNRARDVVFDIDNATDIQAIFPYIKEEWIIEIESEY